MIARAPFALGAPVAAAALGAVATLTTGPVIAAAVAAVLLIAVASAVYPTVAAIALAVTITSNAAAVATDNFGAPPLGALMTQGAAAVIVVRRILGLEDLSTAIRIAPLLLLFFGVHAISLLWVEYLDLTLMRLSIIAKDFVIVLVFAALITSRERLHAIAWAIAATVAALSALSVFQFVTGSFDHDFLGFSRAAIKGIADDTMSWRLEGPVGDANYYGQLLVTGLPLVVAMIFAAKSAWLRIAGLAGVPLVLAAIVLTYSRGALVGLAAVAVFAVLMARQRVAAIGAVAALAVLVLAAAPDMVVKRLIPIAETLSAAVGGGQSVGDMALGQRLSVMRAATAMFADSPLLGVGTWQFSALYPDYALKHGLDLGAPPEAHSRFLETAAEGGLLGLLNLFAFIAVVAWAGIRASARFEANGERTNAILTRASVLSFAGYFSTAMFLHGAFERILWLVLALVVAAWAVARDERHHASETRA
jgi:O-antigen ligase